MRCDVSQYVPDARRRPADRLTNLRLGPPLVLLLHYAEVWSTDGTWPPATDPASSCQDRRQGRSLATATSLSHGGACFGTTVATTLSRPTAHAVLRRLADRTPSSPTT